MLGYVLSELPLSMDRRLGIGYLSVRISIIHSIRPVMKILFRHGIIYVLYKNKVRPSIIFKNLKMRSYRFLLRDAWRDPLPINTDI